MSMHDWDVQRKQWLWNEWKKENTNEEKQMSGRKEKRTDSDRRFNKHRFSRERMIHVFVWWAEGCFFLFIWAAFLAYRKDVANFLYMRKFTNFKCVLPFDFAFDWHRNYNLCNWCNWIYRMHFMSTLGHKITDFFWQGAL